MPHAVGHHLTRQQHRHLSQRARPAEHPGHERAGRLHLLRHRRHREILELAQQVTAVERADDNGDLDSVSVLPDPNVGALTQIFREYAPPDVPVIIENVVTDIDTIVR
jgi:hypothetical protein